jgi:hypothetical protein
MAILSYLILNAIVSLLFAGLLAGVVGRPAVQNRRLGLIFYFILLFVANWAGALWIAPFGPMIYGASILPIVLVAVGASLLIGVSALTPYERDACATPVGFSVFGVYFWLTLVILAVVILGRYIMLA